MHQKHAFQNQTRKKLGISQEHLAAMLNVSRAYVALAETGRRDLPSGSNTFMANIYLQFHELETGKQLAYRSLETRAYLNHEYKKILPQMEAMEKYSRLRLKMMNKQLEDMKEHARDAENSIIVLSTAIYKIKEDETAARQVEWLDLLKQDAYRKLLSNWEPEQAKLHIKIEALAGEARALRRYRMKVIREHGPFAIKKAGKNKKTGS